MKYVQGKQSITTLIHQVKHQIYIFEYGREAKNVYAGKETITLQRWGKESWHCTQSSRPNGWIFDKMGSEAPGSNELLNKKTKLYHSWTKRLGNQL